MTAAGAVLVEEARDIVDRLDAAYAKVRSAGDDNAGLRVGVPIGTPSGIVAALVSAADEFPVDLEVAILGSHRQMSLLGRRDLDLGILDGPADGFAAGCFAVEGLAAPGRAVPDRAAAGFCLVAV